jgi:methionyl-tRNA formyltransferase
MTASSAIVFAYHNVGVRCLSVLLAHDVNVPLVVSHDDDPRETIWFDSVKALAESRDIPVLTPVDARAPELLARVQKLQPDFIFSFYYRQLLPTALLRSARRGAFNMHGSLLPKFRGRAPVNWAVIMGEKETGATLHHMAEKPDAGPVVGRFAVPILPDDAAVEVFDKVTFAAELLLDRCLPDVLRGTAQAQEMELVTGSYFGGRKPEDGRIDWNREARVIHNLVRGVAPPYPGAFSTVQGKPLRILKTLVETGRRRRGPAPGMYCEGGRCYADCVDGGVLRVLRFELDGTPCSADRFSELFGLESCALGI